MKIKFFPLAAAMLLGFIPSLRAAPLVITCPTNRTVWTCGASSVAVAFPAPTTTGGCTTNIIKACTPPSGNLFPLGTSTVLCSARDGCVTQQCTFTITVRRDTNAPTVVCPSNIVVWTCATNPIPVTWATPVGVDDHDPNPLVSCSPPSGSLFANGVRIVSCDATDACTNRGPRCSFTVTVLRDTNAPSITCAGNVTVECGTAWSFPPPTAIDDCSGTNVAITVASTVTNAHCGNTFTVTRRWRATDACGNSALCSQSVTVVDTTPPLLTCPANRTVECGTARGQDIQGYQAW